MATPTLWSSPPFAERSALLARPIVMDERTALLPRAQVGLGAAAGDVAAPTADSRIRNLLLAYSFLTTITINMMGAFLPLEAVALRIAPERVGVIFAVSPLCIALLSAPAGWACGRIGCAPVLLTSVLAIVVANASLAALPLATLSPGGSFGALVAARTIMGIGSATGSAAIFFGLALCYPDAMGAINGQVETSIGVGYAAGTALGGFLYGAGGWSLPFALGAVLQLLCGLAVWAVLASALRQREAPEADDAPSSAAAASPGWALLCTPGYVLPTAALFVAAVGFAVPGPVLPVYWAHLGLSVQGISMLQAAMALLYAVCSIGGGHVSDRTRPDHLIIAGLLVAGLTYGLIGSQVLLLSAATYLLWGVLAALIIVPSVPALLAAVQCGGPEVVGLALGIEESAYFAGEVIGPVAGAWARERYGLQATLRVMAVVMLLYAVGYGAYVLLRGHPRGKAEVARE